MGRRVTIILILLLSLYGCGVKQVARQGTSEVRLIAHEERADSTRHQYKLEVITIYNEMGGISRVEERAEGEVQYRTKVLRDTAFIHVTDTLYIAKGDAAPTDPSVVKLERGRGTTSRWWATAVIIISIAVIIYVLGKRNRQSGKERDPRPL